MANKSSNLIIKITFFTIWLFIITLIGSIVLIITSSRIGQQNESTFGRIYKRFVKSWGGEINIIPASFYIERKYDVKEFNPKSNKYENKIKIEKIELIPNDIQIDADINLTKKKEGLINFNSFIVETDNKYILKNNSKYSDNLLIEFKRPTNANIIYDYLIYINDEKINKNFNIDKPFILFQNFKKSQEIKINIKFTTKGIDVIKYKLDEYEKYVLSSFKAVLNINTSKYNILRFGFPHNISKNKNGEKLIVEMKDFSTTQDVGISFVSIINDLDQIERLIRFSPISLIMFILIIFVLSQLKNIKFNAIHYLFFGIINIFYFLFIAYIIRFFNVFITLSISFLLTSLMYIFYIPNVTNKKFAFKNLVPYHLALTIILSLIFLLPIYRGISIITILFLVFISIMIPIGKSDISKWPILLNDNK